jgi:hypothetical protein
MKFINSFCGTVTVFVVLLITAYSGIAIGDNCVEELYTVKINGIPFRRDVAENVLLRINSNYKREGIMSYNNTQKTNIQLKKIEKGMNISIGDSNLLLDLSNLYESRGSECGDISGECMLESKKIEKFKGKMRRIEMNISNGVVSYLVVF